MWKCYRQTNSNTYTREKYINFTVDTVITRPIMKHLKRLYTALESHGRKQAGIKGTQAAVPAAKQPPSRGRKEVGARAPTPLGGHNLSSAGAGLRGDGAPRPRVGRGVTVTALGGDRRGQAGCFPRRWPPQRFLGTLLPPPRGRQRARAPARLPTAHAAAGAPGQTRGRCALPPACPPRKRRAGPPVATG